MAPPSEIETLKRRQAAALHCAFGAAAVLISLVSEMLSR
jgi:hypothetical protein